MTRTHTARIRVASCGNGDDCPALDPGKDGGIEVTGYPVDRPNLLEGEAVVWVPPHLLPEIADLSIRNLGDWIAARHRTDLLRVQTLDFYNVGSDGDDFHRYLSGATTPAAPGKQAWLSKLRDDATAGKYRRNVHIVNEPVSDYLRYQFEWCYQYNVAAGQDIRILDTTRTPVGGVLAVCGDFSVVEGVDVARNRYDGDGTFLGAVQASADAAPVYAALAETAWQLAVPFTEWWATHPHYHRATRAA